MKSGLKIAALIFGISTFAAAHAQQGLYVGVNLGQAEYDEDGFPSAEPTAISFKVGNQFNKNFAVEARLGTGLSDDDVSISGQRFDVEVDNFYGVYAKGIVPLSGVFSLYGLVGYTHGEITGSGRGISASSSDSDFSYGIGADFAVSKTLSVNFEWARLFEGDNYKVNALSAGVAYKF